jgi:hypothetical protein
MVSDYISMKQSIRDMAEHSSIAIFRQASQMDRLEQQIIER